MVGLAIFAIMGLYGIVSLILLVKIPQKGVTRRDRSMRFVVSLVLVLAFPAGDPIVSYLIYKNYCMLHGGASIYYKYKGVKSICITPGVGNFPVDDRNLLKALDKYTSIEEKQGDAKFYKWDMPITTFEMHPVEKLESQFIISLSITEYNRWYRVEEFAIHDINGTTLGTFRFVGWHGGGFTGPAFNFVTGGYGAPKRFSHPRTDVLAFIYNVLSPN